VEGCVEAAQVCLELARLTVELLELVALGGRQGPHDSLPDEAVGAFPDPDGRFAHR
jgi:hypothetical protein